MRDPDQSEQSSWLGNYTINSFDPGAPDNTQYGAVGDVTDLDQVEAHVLSMQQFASTLKANVEKNYLARVPAIQEGMLTQLPPVDTRFFELYTFLGVHNQAQNNSQKNVFNYGTGTAGFADAAHQVSQDYSGSDAYARAKVGDVDKALDTSFVTNGGLS